MTSRLLTEELPHAAYGLKRRCLATKRCPGRSDASIATGSTSTSLGSRFAGTTPASRQIRVGLDSPGSEGATGFVQPRRGCSIQVSAAAPWGEHDPNPREILQRVLI